MDRAHPDRREPLLAGFFALQRTGVVRVLEDKVAALGRPSCARPNPGPNRARRSRAPSMRCGGAPGGAISPSRWDCTPAWLFGVAEVAIVLACIGTRRSG